MKSMLRIIPLSVLALLLPLNHKFTQAYKVAILSDLHLQPYYDPYVDVSSYCQSKLPVKGIDEVKHSHDYAPLGRIYCDPPAALIEAFLKNINQTETKIDALILTGDFIGHSMPIEPEDPDQPELYQMLLDVHDQVNDLIAKHLPNTLILPTMGNNDYKYHYQSPYESDKQEFYTYLFNQWFVKHQVNNQLDNLADIHSTFMNGGYYRVDLSENVTFLGLNTLMYNRRNEPSK